MATIKSLYKGANQLALEGRRGITPLNNLVAPMSIKRKLLEWVSIILTLMEGMRDEVDQSKVVQT
jgi:hypothetical protein